MAKICCFTGSRDINYSESIPLSKKLDSVLVDLIENQGYTDFRAGGARGFDMIAALAVLKMKSRYPHIKLHLFIPCKNQDKFFSRREREYYSLVLRHADSHVLIQEHYSSGVMQKRNRAMVDGSDICVAFLKKLGGGTYYTVKYAKKQNIEVINLKNA